MIMLCLAGDVAENIFEKKDSRDLELTDYDNAVDLARHQCGDPDEAGAYVNWLFYKTKNILRLPDNWKAVESLSEALIKRRRIGSRKAYEIIRSALEDEDGRTE